MKLVLCSCFLLVSSYLQAMHSPRAKIMNTLSTIHDHFCALDHEICTRLQTIRPLIDTLKKDVQLAPKLTQEDRQTCEQYCTMLEMFKKQFIALKNEEEYDRPASPSNGLHRDVTPDPSSIVNYSPPPVEDSAAVADEYITFIPSNRHLTIPGACQPQVIISKTPPPKRYPITANTISRPKSCPALFSLDV